MNTATQDKIEVLKRALLILEQPVVDVTVCKALCLATPFGFVDDIHPQRGTANDLQRYIMNQLGGHARLESWLSYHRLLLNCSQRHMMMYRRQWVQWMIACLEEDNESAG